MQPSQLHSSPPRIHGEQTQQWKHEGSSKCHKKVGGPLTALSHPRSVMTVAESSLIKILSIHSSCLAQIMLAQAALSSASRT